MELSNVHRSQHALVFLGLNHCDKLCETGWERNQNADYKDWRELTPDSEHEMFKASAHYAVPTTITRVFVGTLRRRQTTSIVSVQLPSTDKFVHKVSRTHFILSLENGIWHLEDRSTHGTEVNGTQLARDPSSQTSESSASSQATMRSASYVRSRRSCPSKIALHPGIWNDILAGELKLSIRALGPEPYPKLPQDLPSTIPAMTRLCYIVKKYRSYSPGNDTYIAVDKLSGEILEAQLAFSPESIRAMKNVTLLLNPLRVSYNMAPLPNNMCITILRDTKI